MATSQQAYLPGVCNIGPAEIAQRRTAGWLGLGITVVAWALFFAFHVPAGFRLLLFIPAALGASGFLQAAFHFCAGFAMRGVFNLGPKVGTTEPVESEEFRRKDRAKASRIMIYSALIGIVIALAGFFLR